MTKSHFFMFKKILSYLVPVPVFKTQSKINKSIEVNWNNGELVLDSENTNYSYGSLQRILRFGMKNIGFQRISKMNRILVLGVAGGSVIKTLVNEIHFKGKITGVEIDPKIIAVSNTYFNLDQIENVEIVIEDAFEFILKTKNKYDLIIIDIFRDTVMPGFLFEDYFTNQICAITNKNGLVLFNTMCLTKNDDFRNSNFIGGFHQENFQIKTIPRVENHNELIIIENIK